MKRSKRPFFSFRQRQVVHLLLAGNTNAQISKELGIGVRTVDDYVRVLFRKCGVHSRLMLALVVVREHLLDR